MATILTPRRRGDGPASSSRPSARPDPAAVEAIQRGRMALDVATADLEVAEARLGPFHEVSRYFREGLAEARRAWDRLRALHGGPALESALARPPAAILTLGGPGDREATLLLIGGRTYGVERLDPTPLAPLIWRLTRLLEQEDGPYHAARLRDGSTRCDCAEWTYQVMDVADAPPCKHLAALTALAWL